VSFLSYTIPLLRSKKEASTMSIHTNAQDELSGVEVFVIVILIENTQFEAYGPVIIGATFAN
jgi:hypothetical protein